MAVINSFSEYIFGPGIFFVKRKQNFMLIFTLRVHRITDVQILQWLCVSCHLNCMCGRDLEIAICSNHTV